MLKFKFWRNKKKYQNTPEYLAKIAAYKSSTSMRKKQKMSHIARICSNICAKNPTQEELKEFEEEEKVEVVLAGGDKDVKFE